MIGSKEITRILDKLYGDIRRNNQREELLRRVRVNKEIPEYEDIESKINRSFVSLVKINAKEGSKNNILEIKKEVELLRNKKNSLLQNSGFPKDYLESIYTCNLCEDTGFIDNKPCSCRKPKIAKIAMDNSEFSTIMKKYTFNTFDLNRFSDEIIEGEPMSAKTSMEGNLRLSKIFINHFDEEIPGLLFKGKSGTGKTFLATCIANALMEKGELVIYKTAARIIEDLHAQSRNNDKMLKAMLFESDCLIIDDLGTENLSDYSKNLFFELINSRILNGKKMIISTNLEKSEIRDLYDERFASRITGHHTSLLFTGADQRIKNTLKSMELFRNLED